MHLFLHIGARGLGVLVPYSFVLVLFFWHLSEYLPPYTTPSGRDLLVPVIFLTEGMIWLVVGLLLDRYKVLFFTDHTEDYNARSHTFFLSISQRSASFFSL